MKLYSSFYGVLSMMILLVPVNADVYMHNPRGSNDRLDGQNRNRANGNRLFDSQNNNRGGYNVGRDKAVDSGVMKYYAGSILPIEWTNQHECGGAKSACDIIIQYMCDNISGQKGLRDGTTTGTIRNDVKYHCEEGKENDPSSPLNGRSCNDATIKRYGMQESQLHYARCITRKRDEGLYTADQNLRGSSAKYTRQNPKGTRRGLECPEERDYYPYPRPSPWIDVAMLTNNMTRCSEFAKESQNVIPKYECRFPQEIKTLETMQRTQRGTYLAPLTKAACEAKTYTTRTRQKLPYEWVKVEKHPGNHGEPKCEPSRKSRDNHLGMGQGPNVPGGSDKKPRMNVYNWKIPDTPGKNCVLRLRYNISIGDYPSFDTDFLNDNTKSKECYPRIPIGADYGLNPSESNNRGYKIENNPQMKPLGTPDGTVGDRFVLQLAINTAQTGRTFQDRSHKFEIIPRKTDMPPATPIINVGVSGKRGNIVQVYPSQEYHYVPNDLVVNQGDMVHFQWTGSLRNPQNNDGEGKKGTDKSNIIGMKPKNYDGKLPTDVLGNYGNSYPENINTQTVLSMSKADAKEAAKPTPKSSTSGDETEDDEEDDAINNDSSDEEKDIETMLTKDVDWLEQIVDDESTEDDEDTMELEDAKASPASSRRRRRRRRRRRSQRRRQSSRRRRNNGGLLNDSPAYVNLPVVKTSVCAIFHYMCTRNNNFSNRSQKGQIEVKNCK